MDDLAFIIIIIVVLAASLYYYVKIKFYLNNKRSEQLLNDTIKMVELDDINDLDAKDYLYELVNILIDKKIVVFRTEEKLKKNQKIKLYYVKKIVKGTVVKSNYKKDRMFFKTKPRKLKLYKEGDTHENK